MVDFALQVHIVFPLPVMFMHLSVVAPELPISFGEG